MIIGSFGVLFLLFNFFSLFQGMDTLAAAYRFQKEGRADGDRKTRLLFLFN